MNVGDEVFGMQGLGVFRADIHAAHEGQLAIHHQYLAVVAHVEKRHAPGQPGVQETGRRDAAGLETMIGGRMEIAGADTVNQHAHRDAAHPGRDQGV